MAAPYSILCNTLKKEGRAFRNIGKNISLYCVISLANFRLLFNLHPQQREDPVLLFCYGGPCKN